MRGLLTIIALLIGGFSLLSAQEPLLYNGGTVLFVQKNAVLHVDGDVEMGKVAGQAGQIELDGQMELGGNWENESGATVFGQDNVGTFHLVGDTGIQVIRGSSETKFPTLILDRPGMGQEIQIQQQTWVWKGLDLGDDVLSLPNHDFIVLGNAPGALGRNAGAEAPYPIVAGGGIVRTGNGALVRHVHPDGNGSPYLFPVGDGNAWRPVTIAPDAQGPTAFAVRFVGLPSPNAGARDSNLQVINPEWHHIVEERGVPQGPATLRVYYAADLDEVCAPDQAALAGFDGRFWAALPPGAGLDDAPDLGYLESRVDSFPDGAWPLAVAARSQAPGAAPCVFPPDQIVLEAEVQGEQIALQWTTDSEQPGDIFRLERSLEGAPFSLLNFQAAALSLPPHTYNFSDPSLLPNQRYFYRVRQIDQDGEVRLSNTVTALIPSTSLLIPGEFFPNPTADLTHVVIAAREKKDVQFEFINPLGQVVWGQMKTLEEGNNRLEFDLGSLAKGVFLVKIRADQENHLRRIVVH